MALPALKLQAPVRQPQLTQKQRYRNRLTALKNERTSWWGHWQELSEQIQPRKGRFLSNDRNNGGKKNSAIINGTPVVAQRILSSGMMAGITSPARPWFRLTTPDPQLAEVGSVRQWLHHVEERIRQAFQKSNLYNALHQIYGALAVFGTGVMHIEEDTEDTIRAYVFPVGQYALANSSRQRVDTVYREFSLTIGQLVEQFGHDACSSQVQSGFDRGDLETWIDVVHCIEPNRDYDEGKLSSKPWRSCWYEASGAEEKMLRESGYDEFPVMAPRWDVTGEDVYGSSPGMEALGDCRALQLYEKRKAQCVDKIVNPPMRAPTSLLNMRSSLLPGDVTYVDSLQPGQTFAPAIVIEPMAVQVVDAAIRYHEQRINASFYADLWLMLSQGSGGPMTAREVAERHEEKMLQLGPVMERLQDELLDPMIDRVFGILMRNGHLPDAPEELQGADMRVEYISVMAQAQKLLGTTSIERLSGFVGGMAGAVPESLDKVNWDEVIDEYAASLGTKPDLVRTDEEVAAIREARAKAMAQQQAMAQAGQQVKAAQLLSQTDTAGDNALTRLMGNLGGVAAAAGGPIR